MSLSLEDSSLHAMYIYYWECKWLVKTFVSKCREKIKILILLVE